MSEEGLLYVKGRFKSLLISSDGEKYSPEGIEEAFVSLCPTIDQVILYNNQSPYTTALIVPNKDYIKRTLAEKGLDLANLSITSESEAVPLCVCGVDKELGAECGPLALFTSSSASVDTDIGRFIVKNPWSGRGVQKIFTKKDNGDGTVTVSVKFRPCSLRVIIR
jgi:acyl-CoA synthetase (AMP-forming)/AMP-acid ligase II